MTRSLSTALSALAAATLSMAALPAAAQSIFSDSLTVRDGAGTIVEQVVVTEADEVAAGHGFIFKLTTAIDAAQFGNYTTLYDDPLNPNSTGDIFGIASDGAGGLALSFASDIDGLDLSSIYGGAGPNAFLEVAGMSYDATMYLDRALQAIGYTAAFISDAVVVPEPGALSLLGLAGVGLLASRRRQAKSA